MLTFCMYSYVRKSFSKELLALAEAALQRGHLGMYGAVGTGRSSPETRSVWNAALHVKSCSHLPKQPPVMHELLRSLGNQYYFIQRAVGTCRSSPATRTSGNLQSCWHWPKQPRNTECLECSSSCKKLFALAEAATRHARTVKTLRKHCNFMKRAVGTCRSSPSTRTSGNAQSCWHWPKQP